MSKFSTPTHLVELLKLKACAVYLCRFLRMCAGGGGGGGGGGDDAARGFGHGRNSEKSANVVLSSTFAVANDSQTDV
jgi:hypothetical protein